MSLQAGSPKPGSSRLGHRSPHTLPSGERSDAEQRRSDVERKSGSKSRSKSKSRRSHSKKQVAKRSVPRPKKTTGKDTLFNVNDTVRKRWFIKGLIGQGGYGEIYMALDMKLATEVAIKTEHRLRRGKTSKRMILEQHVLLRLQGRPHVPKMIASGHDHRLNFMVMELLSVNIGDLKKQSPIRRLSRSTTARILMQAIGALRDVHEIGFLHRDIKPANMCFGVTPKTRHVLMLVDFGLVRRFRLPNGQLRPPRTKAGFRGTLRYVSLRVHDRLEQAPVDDLISLCYSGIELLIGEVPWKLTVKHDDVRVAKEELFQQLGEPTGYLALTAESFQLFVREVHMLDPMDPVNYQGLQSILMECLGDKKISDPYDWENGYKDVIEPSTKSDSSYHEPSVKTK